VVAGDDHAAGSAVGTVLGGRYVIEEIISRGGMADVYRARDRRLGQTVAVKVFRPSGDPDGARRFASEVRLLAPLNHPGIVTMRDGGIDDSQPFLVMPLVTGGTLADRLVSGPLPMSEVVSLGRELATTLGYLHGRGIVHRDVKPANVLMDQDGRVMLGDFGVSRAVDATRLTTVGQIIGTAAYLAPEQVRGAQATPAADIYALGLVLLECVTGYPVFAGTDPIAVASARLLHDPDLPSGLPADLRATLAGMLATEPERRPTAPECAAQLGAATDGLSESAQTIPLPARPGRTGKQGKPATLIRTATASPGRVRVATLLAVLVAAAVVAVVVPFILSSGHPPSEHVLSTGRASPSIAPTSRTATTSPSPTPAATSGHSDRASTPATTRATQDRIVPAGRTAATVATTETTSPS
jgi:eukaryotic-like serine/threonine-protein kinase